MKFLERFGDTIALGLQAFAVNEPTKAIEVAKFISKNSDEIDHIAEKVGELIVTLKLDEGEK